MKKVFVCCPGGVVTGGPELLHQFVHELRENNVDAYIIYSPFDKTFETPEQYQHYNVAIANFSESSYLDSVVVLPEVNTGMAKLFSGAHIAIWWLSVDFYYSHTGNNPFKEYVRDKLNVIRGLRLPLAKLKSYSHYAQSEYARLFLKSKHIQSRMLTDYLGAAHMCGSEKNTTHSAREKIIAYNPKKGIHFTNQLMQRNPEIDFVPIINMTPAQVRELLSRAMIYIDFGNHPGKDRFPREAAMAGCCIITGSKGSAANGIDIPIPKKYKLNENSKDVFLVFDSLVNEIFYDYASHILDFNDYKKTITLEPTKFKEQVIEFIANEL